ncbi:MAG: substrate-binding domain-containing protein [Pseudomonadota bacterium]
MRKLALSLALILAPLTGFAFEIEDHIRFGAPEAAREIRIISTADIAFFEPVVRTFIAGNADVAVDYSVASSTELMRAIYDEGAAFDLAISSAMDLQIKLANDGFARRYISGQELPDWATWRDTVFAFTQEPAAIVVSDAAFEGLAKPQNRQELIRVLRQNPDRFAGRVGTYDVRQSGLGYLFATQDTRASETYWRLTEVMGSLRAKLFCCSSDMIDAVENGELAVAYNVLGSYAANRQDSGRFSIILPTDFTTVMLRTALIPETAPSPELAELFLDHMLQQAFVGSGGVRLDRSLVGQGAEAGLNRIDLGPGLLVFLDQLKRRAFLSEWESAILQR